MEITRELATDIVKEMKKIIGKDINYINKEGEIVASTDKKRIGTLHLGAKEVIKKHKVVVIQRDEEYLGAKEGINLPVKFNDRIIGVIGVSGKKTEVEKFGQIIKKMTEILIKEAYLKEKEGLENEYEKILLEHLLLERNIGQKSLIVSSILEEIALREKGEVISIKLENIKNINKGKKYFEIIKKIIKVENGYLMSSNGIINVLVFNKDRDAIQNIIEKIKEDMSFYKDIDINFGVGRSKNEVEELKISYDESLTALEWSIKNKKTYFYYEDMKLEIILNNIDEMIKEKYIKQLFKNLDFSEIEEFKEIFIAYEKYNGSINEISKEIYIHKNTLQYRINKFRDKTGLDIRNYKDFAILKIAYMILFSTDTK